MSCSNLFPHPVLLFLYIYDTYDPRATNTSYSYSNQEAILEASILLEKIFNFHISGREIIVEPIVDDIRKRIEFR